MTCRNSKDPFTQQNLEECPIFEIDGNCFCLLELFKWISEYNQTNPLTGEELSPSVLKKIEKDFYKKYSKKRSTYIHSHKYQGLDRSDYDIRESEATEESEASDTSEATEATEANGLPMDIINKYYNGNIEAYLRDLEELDD